MAIFTYSVLSKKCLCTSVTKRKVHSYYISFFTALCQHVILLIELRSFLDKSLSSHFSTMHLICIHLLEKLNARPSLKRRDQFTYRFRIYHSNFFPEYVIFNICHSASRKMPDFPSQCNTFSKFIALLYNQNRLSEITFRNEFI